MPPDGELRSWLLVHRLPGIGPAAIAAILDGFDSPADYLAATEAAREARGLDPAIVRAPRQAARVQAGVEADYQWYRAGAERHVITLADTRYPAALRDIPDPPGVLFVRGDPEALATPQLGIVGSRNATPGGLHSAGDFAAHLAASGLTITSGLALGIDAEAHQGALAAGGQTVAVMATGPDRLYPREHAALATQITKAGALVSEMPTGTAVNRGLFPRRNRLISGLSLGVLVVEAGRRSGALGTAHQAVEQGREVMAIPGSIHNPVAKGCHQLIREGARLVEKADDVIEEIRKLPEGWMMTTAEAAATGAGDDGPADAPAETALDADYMALLEAMGYDPIGFETLAERTSLTPDILSSMLLSLELTGHVAPCNGGHYMRISNRAGG